jgi:hypothetical protein
MGRTEAGLKDCERALVVDARSEENNQDHSLECFRVVCSKKDLTEPTLLEITGKPTYRELRANERFCSFMS